MLMLVDNKQRRVVRGDAFVGSRVTFRKSGVGFGKSGVTLYC